MAPSGRPNPGPRAGLRECARPRGNQLARCRASSPCLSDIAGSKGKRVDPARGAASPLKRAAWPPVRQGSPATFEPYTGGTAAAGTAGGCRPGFHPELGLQRLTGPRPLPLRAKWRFSLPRWGVLIPPLAASVAQRALQKQLGPAIREQVNDYDRQLRAWLKDCIAHLGELYESEVEVFREQLSTVYGQRRRCRYGSKWRTSLWPIYKSYNRTSS